MTNTYILERKKGGISVKARRILWAVVHFFFRMSVVLSGVLILGVIAGVEFGPIMLGRRLLMIGMLIIMLLASVVGMNVTDMELPFDGGEEDE